MTEMEAEEGERRGRSDAIAFTDDNERSHALTRTCTYLYILGAAIGYDTRTHIAASARYSDWIIGLSKR